jgi:hypothetical protein
MDAAALDSILAGKSTLFDKRGAETPVFVPSEEMRTCTTVLAKLFKKVTGTRPLKLESAQLPPIF